MQTLAYTLDLKDDPEAIRRYDAYHANPWPEVVDALRAVGLHELLIWRLDRRLFMLARAGSDFDPDVDFARYLTLHPRCQEWEDLMGTLQAPLPQAPAGTKWVRMDRIFTL